MSKHIHNTHTRGSRRFTLLSRNFDGISTSATPSPHSVRTNVVTPGITEPVTPCKEQMFSFRLSFWSTCGGTHFDTGSSEKRIEEGGHPGWVRLALEPFSWIGRTKMAAPGRHWVRTSLGNVSRIDVLRPPTLAPAPDTSNMKYDQTVRNLDKVKAHLKKRYLEGSSCLI